MDTSPPPPFSVTDSALNRISALLANEPAGSVLRVSVSGGGCSGFQYGFSIDGTSETDDLKIVKEGVTVVVDPASLPFVSGATLDFVDDLIGQSFRVDNPNATASCGCGTSFSVG